MFAEQLLRLRSPRRCVSSVDPTMSVKRIVWSPSRIAPGLGRGPPRRPRKSEIAPMIGSTSPSAITWMSPSSGTNLAPGCEMPVRALLEGTGLIAPAVEHQGRRSPPAEGL